MNNLFDIDFIPKKLTMLSTKDNPYNPFTNYDEWWRFDFEKGYHSPEVLAKFAFVSDALSEEEVKEEIESAIDYIVEHDAEKRFIKVTKQN